MPRPQAIPSKPTVAAHSASGSSHQNQQHAPRQNRAVSVDHYENFPVASVLCPPRIRPAVVAIYHFARTADDLADEGDATPAQRLVALAAYRAELHAALAAQPCSEPRQWPALFAQLRLRAAQFALPASLLHALLDAFEQDVRNPPYADRPALLDYCKRSANPVGRLLLHLYGIKDARSLQEADAICCALQLINFWQDLSVDGARGRLYVPHSDLQAHQLKESDIRQCVDSPATRRLVATLCAWARALMHEGAPLALRVPGRAGWELRLVVQGGLCILDKIAAMDHATLKNRPTLGKRDVPRVLWRAWRMAQTHPARAAAA
jgi:hydroxysqualene synthase